MAFYQIKDIGKVGVVTDLSPTDLPPNAFTDAINARFIGGQITKFGGNKPITYNGPENSVTAYAIQPMPFDSRFDHPFNILGTSDGLYLLEDTKWENISYWEPIKSGVKTETVTVTSHPLMTGIKFTESQVNVKSGQKHDFYVELIPEGVKKQDLVWELSNVAVGTLVVDPDNPLHAVFTADSNTVGSSTVNVSNKDGSVSDFSFVNVTPNIDALSFNQAVYNVRRSTEVNTANMTHASILFSPPGNTRPLTLISSDTSVFTIEIVDESKFIYAIKPGRVGSADIIAQVTDSPSIKTKSRVNVTAGVTSVTVVDPANHSVTKTSVILKFNPSVPRYESTKVEVLLGPSDAPDKTFMMNRIGSTDASTLVRDDVSSNRLIYTVTAANEGKDIYQFIANDGGVTGMLQVTVQIDNSLKDEPVLEFAPDEVSLFAMPASPVDTPDQSIVSVSLDKTTIDFNQGDKETITATVVTSDGKLDNLVYHWKIVKDGVITHDALDEKELTVYGLGNGHTEIILSVWPTKQKGFNVRPGENPWYHTTIANCAVFNTNNFQPMVKEYGSTMFKTLPGWGEQTVVDEEGNWSVETSPWRCERVRAFNNRLFAMNMTEEDSGGTERHYPQRLRWSNFATENKAPTLWDDLADLRDPEDNNSAEGTLKALTNGYAGYIDLADTQGDLMDILPLKDYLFVYTEFETYVGTPTMNAYQPMTFKKLFNDSGILAPGCAVEVEGGQFVVTQNDIILHNGATKQSIANNIVKEHIIQEINAINPAATRVYLHQDKKEVWICYVAHGQPKNTWYNSKAAVWNYEFQTWTFYELPHTYEIVLSDPPTLDKTATWGDYAAGGKLENMTWEQLEKSRQPWQTNFLNFRRRVTLACSAMKGLYHLDTGSYTWSATNITEPDNLIPTERPLKMAVERYGIDFDNITEEWRQKHVNNFHFQVNGTGNLNIEVGGTQFSNERGHQHNYRDYIAGKTRNLSVRLNHPYLFYGIVDEDPLSTAHMSGLVIDFALGGRR